MVREEVLGVETGGMQTSVTRRDLLKRSAIAGALIWAAPVIVAQPAGATHECGSCTGCNRLYGIKYEPGRPPSAADAEVAVTTGHCLSSHGCTTFLNGTCLHN